MQNLPISPLAAPQSGVILPDTAVPKVPYGESFNAILARESSGKTFADEIIDNVPPASATTASLLPQAEVEPTTLLLQLDTELIPLGQNPAAPALLTLVPGTINPQSSRAVELSTELSALPTLPTAPATYPDKPGWEPVEFVDTADRKNTADSAAPGKFLPPLVAPDSAANSGTGQPTASQISDASLVSQPNNLALVGAAPAPAPIPVNVVPTSAAVSIKLDIQLRAPTWGDQFTQKIVWLAGQQQQVAELHLNPPHLGPVEVILNIANDRTSQPQANAQFTSPHLAVREAIEAALPRLREMMADNGITLGNVTVSADSFRQQDDAGRHNRPSLQHLADEEQNTRISSAQIEIPPHRGGHNGMVDTFA